MTEPRNRAEKRAFEGKLAASVGGKERLKKMLEEARVRGRDAETAKIVEGARERMAGRGGE